MERDGPLELNKACIPENGKQRETEKEKKRKKKNMSCHECGEERAGGFEWMVVTCGCGCEEERRTCDLCAPSLPTYVDHIKIYRKYFYRKKRTIENIF